ncbi:MAG TPA: cysteine synthase A [Candidatus Eubacterium avistercoris]|uniref:Cysteine synthase n=1 Tax=Candidatus Eubacterium avistercoris TaxID=2838567 RepID=A0A9D2D501_9FIRM|nr:cysteine synthase A [Candidatus Eubacterium avistercoris]
MSGIYRSNSELIGRTPIMELSHIEQEYGLEARIFAKLEYLNPGGSVKDRIARAMIREGERTGAVRKGAVIVEPTSGNTGIALAAVGAAKGYQVILVMPDTMSVERRRMMEAYGAKLVLTDGAGGMKKAVEKAKEIVREIPGAFMPGQFENPANPKAHFDTTGPEIWEDTKGGIDIFVAGVGTGGTITGAGRYLKRKNPHIRIAAVEPAASPVLSGGKPGPHKIQGIGAGFIPGILDISIYDEVITVSDEEAVAAAKLIGKKEGILTGISSGAALFSGVQLAGRPENKGKNIVVLLPDSGDRYMSTILYADHRQE